MSVNVRDFRKHQEAKAQEEERAVPHIPVEQVHVPDERLTGDERFDKFLRAVEKKVQEHTEMGLKVAQQVAAMINDEDIRKGQLIYAYHQGLIAAYTEAAKLPAQILVEEHMK
mgnify:CR=1 FL=1